MVLLLWCFTVVHGRLNFINASWTPYHAVEEASQRLMAAGFTHIAEKDAWNLKPGAATHMTTAWATAAAAAAAGGTGRQLDVAGGA